MLGLYKLFPDMFLEQVRQLSYYSNLGLFWEVMAPVFFEMSDIYDEGGFKGVPDAMDFLVNGIFAVAGRPIYHHDWLEGKRKSRQCCRVVGESRTGKTIACNAYRLRHKPIQETGKPPIVPVVYIEPPQDCGSIDLFRGIIEHLKYKVQSREKVRELRSRAMKVLERCQVETLLVDEADRLKPKTFADVRDIFDKLNISVVLIGTDRLDTVIKRDEQVHNRFRACYRFGKLTGMEFEQVVRIWERDILRLPVPSNLHGLDLTKEESQADQD